MGDNSSNTHSNIDNYDLIIGTDSTDIKTTTGVNGWIANKWDTQSKKKKGYMKIRIDVDIKTKEILALEVTDEPGHNGQEMNTIVGCVLKRKGNK